MVESWHEFMQLWKYWSKEETSSSHRPKKLSKNNRNDHEIKKWEQKLKNEQSRNKRLKA